MKKNEPDDSSPFSSRWRKKHLVELLEAGIPDVIAEDQRAWSYTLLHAEYFPMGWSLSWISEDEMKRLHALLTSTPPPHGEIWLLQKLNQKLYPATSQENL